MRADPVVEEVRRARHAYAEQFDFNLRAMAEDLRRKEQQHTELVVAFSPKPVRRRRTA